MEETNTLPPPPPIPHKSCSSRVDRRTGRSQILGKVAGRLPTRSSDPSHHLLRGQTVPHSHKGKATDPRFNSWHLQFKGSQLEGDAKDYPKPLTTRMSARCWASGLSQQKAASFRWSTGQSHGPFSLRFPGALRVPDGQGLQIAPGTLLVCQAFALAAFGCCSAGQHVLSPGQVSGRR